MLFAHHQCLASCYVHGVMHPRVLPDAAAVGRMYGVHGPIYDGYPAVMPYYVFIGDGHQSVCLDVIVGTYMY